MDPNAPVIAEWNKTVASGESFALSGIRFTTGTGADAGTDTTVWVWADTPAGGMLVQAQVWSVSDTTIN